MFTIIFCGFLTIFLLIILFKLLNFDNFITILISIFIFLFIINMKSSINAIISSLNLIVQSIIPTLFPFSIICNLLICFNGISLYSKFLNPIICKPFYLSKESSFPVISSVICGYPLGAKYSADLYENKLISKNEFERLLCIASNASPIFILGTIGISMLQNASYGYIILIANYLPLIIIGFLTKRKAKKLYSTNNLKIENKNLKYNFGSALKFSIESSINTILLISSFIIIFSIIINIIKNNAFINIVFTSIESNLNLPENILINFIVGCLEFTSGCKAISISNLYIPLKLSIISFFCSFSSMSILFQINTLISKYNINFKKYILYKIFQGILSFVITYILASILLI